MKMLSLLIFMLSSVQALACTMERISARAQEIKAIVSSEEVLNKARTIGGITSVSLDSNQNGYWVNNLGCGFQVKPVYVQRQHKEGQPVSCPELVGVELAEGPAVCALPR